MVRQPLVDAHGPLAEALVRAEEGRRPGPPVARREGAGLAAAEQVAAEDDVEGPGRVLEAEPRAEGRGLGRARAREAAVLLALGDAPRVRLGLAVAHEPDLDGRRAAPACFGASAGAARARRPGGTRGGSDSRCGEMRPCCCRGSTLLVSRSWRVDRGRATGSGACAGPARSANGGDAPGPPGGPGLAGAGAGVRGTREARVDALELLGARGSRAEPGPAGGAASGRRTARDLAIRGREDAAPRRSRTAWTRADALSAVRGRRVVQADGDEKEDPRSPPREKRAPPSRSRDKGLPPPPVVRRRCRDMAGRWGAGPPPAPPRPDADATGLLCWDSWIARDFVWGCH